jgi:uncharacterized protein YndB with AHSA1/START domain
MLTTVTREELIAADVETVWGALTEADQVARWFGNRAEIDLRVGGGVRFGWPAGEVSTGVITVLEPGSRFAFSWDVFGTVADPNVFTTVEFWLRPEEGGTRVRVEESGLEAVSRSGVAPNLEELVEEHIDGWRNEMSDLVRYVAGRVADRSRADGRDRLDDVSDQASTYR